MENPELDSPAADRRSRILGRLMFWTGVVMIAAWLKFGTGKSTPEPVPPVALTAQGSSFDQPGAAASGAVAPGAPLASPRSESPSTRPADPSASAPRPAASPEAPGATRPPQGAAPNPSPPSRDAGPRTISFSALAFQYRPKAKNGGQDSFPPPIRALAGTRITLDGFVMPLELEAGRVKYGLLSRSTFGCCFADSPRIWEIVKVLPGNGKPFPFYFQSRMTGTLEVGEEYDVDGYITSIYRMKVDTVAEVPGSR